MIFLPPDLPRWDPYNGSYAMNEASYLGQSGDIMYPTLKHPSRLEEADIAAIKRNWSSSPTTVYEFVDKLKQVDAVIASLLVSLDPVEPNINEILNFKSDPIRAQVADARCVNDPNFSSNTECKHSQVKVLQSNWRNLV